MNKLYYKNFKNNSPDLLIYKNIFTKFTESCNYMPLCFYNFLPIFITSMMQKESVILSDLATIIAPLYEINIESAERKIRRFLKSEENDFVNFYEKFIDYLLSNFKIKHNDKKGNIALDYMHIENKFTILLFSLRIGKTGIPLWFRVFDYNNPEAYQLSLFKEGILFCHNIIKKYNPISKISFLADRFFGNHPKIMDYIDNLGDYYYFRTKKNLLILSYDKKESKYIYKPIHKLNSYKYHSTFYNDIIFTKKNFKTNLAISKSHEHNEPYYIVTNTNPHTAIKEYSKRFGAIEFLFKQEKSAGFFIEETQIRSLKSLTSLFACVCIAQTLLTTLGIDFSKNTRCYKRIKITTSKIVKGKRKKLFSYFHIGLMITHYFFKMPNPINLFSRLILYDV